MDKLEIEKLFSDLGIDSEEKRSIFSEIDDEFNNSIIELTNGLFYSSNTEVNFNAKLESNLK
jgi:hypothetical protein